MYKGLCQRSSDLRNYNQAVNARLNDHTFKVYLRRRLQNWKKKLVYCSYWMYFWRENRSACYSDPRSWLVYTPLTWSITDLGCTCSNPEAINDQPYAAPSTNTAAPSTTTAATYTSATITPATFILQPSFLLFSGRLLCRMYIFTHRMWMLLWFTHRFLSVQCTGCTYLYMECECCSEIWSAHQSDRQLVHGVLSCVCISINARSTNKGLAVPHMTLL